MALLLLALGAVPAPALASEKKNAPTLKRLGQAEERALSRLPEDPKPEALTQKTHFIVTDERNHEYFRDPIRNLGGVFVGVGSHQNYALAGWSRPELMVLIDFDHVIIHLHRLYRVMFLAAPTPAEFLELWKIESRPRVQRLIRQMYPRKRWKRRHVLWAHKFSRRKVEQRLLQLRKRYLEGDIASFVTDQAQYSYIRQLFRSGRVFAVRGDFTGEKTLRRLASVLRRFERVVRVFYISNCEQYFDYTPEFRRNMLALPTDKRSVLLRTRAWREWRSPEDDSEQGNSDEPRSLPLHYTYATQRYDIFRAWLKTPRIESVRQILRSSLLSVEQPHVVLDDLPRRRRRRRRPGPSAARDD